MNIQRRRKRRKKKRLACRLSSTINSTMLRKHTCKRPFRSMKRETRNGTRRRGLHGEQYPLDREEEARARALSEPVKQRRKEEVGGWEVLLHKVRAQGETEVLRGIRTGKGGKKAWRRRITKVCLIGDGFMRKSPQ